MEYLRSIMGEDYSESNVRVRSFDNVLQAMHCNKIEADTNKLFWGKPYEILIEKHLTGIHTGRRVSSLVDDRGRVHYQYITSQDHDQGKESQAHQPLWDRNLSQHQE